MEQTTELPLAFTIGIAPVTKKNHQQAAIGYKQANKGDKGALFTGTRWVIPFPKVFPSKQYAEYEAAAGWFIKGKHGKIAEPVNVKAIYYMPTARKVDITNLHSALHDVLVKYEVLADDCSISPEIVVSTDGSRVYIDRTKPRTEVIITRAEPGEDCQQLKLGDSQ